MEVLFLGIEKKQSCVAKSTMKVEYNIECSNITFEFLAYLKVRKINNNSIEIICDNQAYM